MQPWASSDFSVIEIHLGDFMTLSTRSGGHAATTGTAKKKKREERHRERHREHVRRIREDAQHAARTAILLYAIAIPISPVVGQACMVVTSTITALPLPLLSTQSL